MGNKPRRQGAIAILYRENQFLMQLRDEIPNIVFPGQWALFGGHLEANEPPEVTVKREIWEEVGYQMEKYTLFQQYNHEDACRYVYHASLTVPIEQLTLKEGWDMAMVSIDEIKAGQCYSNKAQEYRLLVPVHRQILLDFLTSSG